MKVTNKVQAAAVLAEIKRRQEQDNLRLFTKAPVVLSPAEDDFYLRRLHPHQQRVLLDPSTKIALLCPRRTGKTTVSLFRTLRTAKIHPGSQIAYIVPSSKHHAKRLFWKPLEEMNIKLRLGLDFKVGEHKVVTPEGTQIYVFGAKNKESPRVLRGNAWSLAVLDECKDFGAHFEELIVEAVMPGLEDYDGTLMLEGTPGDVLQGLFYNITYPREPPDGWSVHKWDKSVNIFMPPEKRDLDLIEKREYLPMGYTRESPKFRREQMAEWCTDANERAYQYDTLRNAWLRDPETGGYELPPGHSWLYVLGLDLGEKDANAFVVGAFSLTHPTLYIVHEYARARMSIDEIADHTRGLIAQYGHMATMVADVGGYGRGIVTDLQERHLLPFEAADKAGNKLGHIAGMNSDFLCGRIKARDDGPCASEWKRLTKKLRPTDNKVLITHSDLGDAALYMWKASKHYAAREKPVEIEPGSVEYFAKLEREAVERAIQRRRRSNEWWGPAITDRREELHT